MRTTAPGTSRGAPAKKRRQQLKRRKRPDRRDPLRLERLEDRVLFTATPVEGEHWGLLSTQAGVCNCPLCTGQGLEQLPSAQIDSGGASEAPLSSLPQLHSNAGATAKLFLDFDGRFTAGWGPFFTNINTPAFDQDGDVTTFSAGELSAINEIWARVAEDYAPYNIDVTTVDPLSVANGVVAVIAIGGHSSDWYGSGAGGVAYVGGFYNTNSNIGFVFENNLSSFGKYIAEAASHEAGHLFGLSHQSTWSGSTLISEYNSGNGAWAPIMGVGYNSTRTTWHNGTTSAAPTAFQDDMSILAGANNGFGYRSDDYGGTVGTATALPAIGTSVNFTGLIGQANDLDVWSFTTTGGAVSFQLTGAQFGSNLDAVLELWNSGGTTILSDSPSGSQGASLTTTLGAGTYYLVARSLGDYGDMGQYTITGSIPAASPSPEIHLSVGGVALADGGALAFGTTTVGASVTRTITVTNQGSAVLTLTPLNGGSLPPGFTLISNLGSTSLNAGASTTFVVRLDATAAGSFSGSLQLFSDDSDESPYDLTLSGTVTAPEIAISVSAANVADGQTVNFGSTTLGQSVSRVFTVTNTGTATLTLTAINAGSLPAGYTLTSNLGSTSLAGGQSTTFTIRLDAAAAGSFGGTIQLLNNDSDESPYDLVLTGSVAAPEIQIAISGVDVVEGQNINFGATLVGQVVSRTFTVTNTGNATLSLTSLNPAGLPAGFSLVSNLGSTSLASGQSTTFCVQLDAAVVGSFTGTVQLANNDADESPFAIALSGVVQAPEIKITLGGVNVSDGQVVDFGNIAVGSTVTRTFVVTNEGTSTLTLTAINPASLPAGFSLLSNLGVASLAAGESTSFTIEFDAAAAGSFGGSIALVNSDSNESPFDLQLQAGAFVPTSGAITLLVAGQELSLGGLVDFGATVTGATLERTFWIRNDGDLPLTLSPLNVAGLPAGYSIYQDLTTTTLAAGEKTCFILRLDATATGAYGGQFSLDSSDEDGPFTFQLAASVVEPIVPLVQVLDNGDAGTSRVGNWVRTSGKGYAGDIHTIAKGSGGASYSWSFSALPPGQYRVWATWASASKNASNAPFSFRDGGVAIGSVAVNQRLAPSGLMTGGTRWKLLTTATVSSGQLTVKLSNAANGQLVADAIRIERVISVLPPAPEIGVTASGNVLVSGCAIDFGSPDLDDPQSRTFTVTNHGNGSLVLTPIDPSSLPAGFSLVENIGTTFLTPGESTAFTVRLNADAAGLFSGAITLANSDGDESCFCLNVGGVVYDPAAAVLQIIEDGSPGNTRSGSWTRVTTGGYSGDRWTANAGNGSISSTWKFNNLANGEYRIQATWRSATNQATNAPYLLFNGGQLISTARVNQRLAPGDVWDGGWWKNLGTITVTGHQLTVKLTNSANGLVVADAIRIEKVLPSGAMDLSSLSLAALATDSHAPEAWSTNLFVSPSAEANMAPSATSGFWVPSSAGPSQTSQTSTLSEPEEQLLADVLDLLAQARHARAGRGNSWLLSVHDAALSALVQQSS